MSNRVKKAKQKIIPVHFQRRKKNISLKQILNTASSQRKNRELLRNNRDLASAFEELQHVAASYKEMLQTFSGQYNNFLAAKMRMKSMAVNFQNLVRDMDFVNECLDLSSMCSINKFFENSKQLRIDIRKPDLDTIEESMLSATESPLPYEMPEFSKSVPSPETSISKDSSFTEVYDVTQCIKSSTTTNPTDSEEIHRSFEEAREQKSRSLSKTPELNLSTLINRNSDNSNKVEAKSKIPVRHKILFPTNINLSSPVNSAPSGRETFVVVEENSTELNAQMPVLLPENRRETFVVTKDNSESTTLLSVSELLNRRETFVIPKDKTSERITPVLTSSPSLTNTGFCKTKSPKKTFEGSGTFLVPQLPSHGPIKPPQYTVANSIISDDICPDERTSHLSEDMELTEIIPTSTFSVCSQPGPKETFSKNKYSPRSFGQEIEEDNANNKSQKSNFKIVENIPQIRKVNATPESKIDFCFKSTDPAKMLQSKKSRNCLNITKNLSTEVSSKSSTIDSIKQISSPFELANENMPATDAIKEKSDLERDSHLTNNENNLEVENFHPKEFSPASCVTLPFEILSTDLLINPKKNVRTSVSKPSTTYTNILDSLSPTENKITNILDGIDFGEGMKPSSKRASSRKSLRSIGRKSLAISRKSIKFSLKNNKTEDQRDKVNLKEGINIGELPFDIEDEPKRVSKPAKSLSRKSILKVLKPNDESNARKKSIARRVSFASVNNFPENDAEVNSDSKEKHVAKKCETVSFVSDKEKGSKYPEQQILPPEQSVVFAPRRSILKRSKVADITEEKNLNAPCNGGISPSNDNRKSSKLDLSFSEGSPQTMEGQTIIQNEVLPETFADLECKTDYIKYSDIFSREKITSDNNLKHTFSGVSERSSHKKRITTSGDDFLDEIEINFPEEVNIEMENSQLEQKDQDNSKVFLGIEATNKQPELKEVLKENVNTSNKQPSEEKIGINNQDAQSEPVKLSLQKSTKQLQDESQKSSKKRRKKTKTEVSDELRISESSKPSRKSIRSSSTSTPSTPKTPALCNTDEQKENVLESCSRSRRAKAVKSYKVDLKSKLRRE